MIETYIMTNNDGFVPLKIPIDIFRRVSKNLKKIHTLVVLDRIMFFFVNVNLKIKLGVI